jgi:perosamine synthetase
VKTMTTGEGGMVTTRSAELRDRLAAFRSHGMSAQGAGGDEPWLRPQHELGFNYRLTDIQSALGRSQLTRLELFVQRRNEIAARYRAALADTAELELAPAAPRGHRHAYHLFVVRHRDGAEARRRVYERLRERGIYTQVHYTPVYLHPWYAKTYGYEPGLCPEAERYYAGCLSLPCYPGLTDAEQDGVIAELREALA